MIRVGVNGYGTIGKRVADAVRAQSDMYVGGIAKRSPNYEAKIAGDRGFDVFLSKPDRRPEFRTAGIEVAGTLPELVANCDVVVDATPAGVGASYASLYDEHATPVVFQGGEDASVAETSFTARATFDRAKGASAVRVVSCNTTGLCRLLTPLQEAFGVESVHATLVRRGGDPNQPDRGPIDDIVPDPVGTPSHHAADARTVLPGLDVHTFAVSVPATIMHLHSLSITCETEPTRTAVRDLLEAEPRIHLVPGSYSMDSCGRLCDFARDAGRPRGDIWENSVWADSLSVSGRTVHLFQAIDQESDVVPENVDAIRAIQNAAGANESRARTNEALGLGFEEFEPDGRHSDEQVIG